MTVIEISINIYESLFIRGIWRVIFLNQTRENPTRKKIGYKKLHSIYQYILFENEQ